MQAGGLMADAEMKPPAVETGTADAPVRVIKPETLRLLGQDLKKTFDQFASERRLTEMKWLRNLRQYLGIYDPEIDSQLANGRSRAYPRVTRIKCISVLSRIMNLMYPGNERNWALTASPSPEMSPEDIQAAVQEIMEARSGDGLESQMTEELIEYAVQKLADKRACELSKLLDDQLQEIGGDQTLDVIALDRKVAQSSIMYGLGVLEGPYVREETKCGWMYDDGTGQFTPQVRTIRKPQFDFLSVWDVYGDMSARSFPGDGYFIRKVMGRSQLRKLANRNDFFGDQIKKYLSQNSQGNFKPREFETELRSMGTKANVNDQSKMDPQNKYEVLVWKGPVSATKLAECGVEIPDGKRADDIDAEIWMVDGAVIKADINPWRKLGMEVKTLHCFHFDEDDTSPIGNGLPNVVRDSQMSICAATRMTLDNAGVTCGPNLELNTQLLRADQDLQSIEAYKIWYRDDDNPATAAFPAVRPIQIDGHIQELENLIKMFMEFADAETFVGPATGGDVSKTPSEPMRTAAGASMLRGDAALPFKDIVRNFDSYKQSVILSLVKFNKKFNPGLAPEGDYNVIARGATSLIAKEVRGMQLDIMAQTMTEDERDHIDDRKFTEQRLAVRDMIDMLLPEEEAKRKKEARQAAAGQMSQVQMEQMQAEIRKTLAEAYKNITQGQKNSAAADAENANVALAILESPLNGQDEKKSKSN